MFTIIDSIEKLQQARKTLSTTDIIACDLEAEGLDTKKSAIQGIGFGTDKDTFFIPYPNGLVHEDIVAILTDIFEKQVIFHNAKFDLQLLLENNFPAPKRIHDTMIMSWLIDENSQHGLKPLSKVILGKEPKSWKDLNKSIDLFITQEDIMQELAEYCCEDVANTFQLYQHFFPQLEPAGVLIDYERIEVKLIPVLSAMEMRGIKVDVSWLQQKQKDASKELSRLEKLILEKIKEETKNDRALYNIRSPKQIETILFDVLKYPVVKETDSKKRSTDNEVLLEIVKKFKLTEDDIVPLLLKFRDLDKVNGTYFVALANQAGLTNTIHANFLQHGTRTGRLSSSDPNLQNIPTRHDEWNVRDAFIPREGFKFLIADYSQIELRMLAHFSRDEHMVKTFIDGGDIHATTMKLTGITDRRIAKNVNFGIVYGVGPRTLSAMINRSEKDAKKYIDSFLNGYPQVRAFIHRVQQLTLSTGIVEMITGRKRHFHEFQDRRWYTTIARQSVNTKIQGSAADLIKIAMIKLNPLLKQYNSHMLVQIHDEIIIEVPLENVEPVKKIITDTMENALKLRVPVIANIVEGDKWIKG